MAKPLLDLTVNEFVDTLVDWAKCGGNYLFLEQFARGSIVEREGKQEDYKYKKPGQLHLYYALTPLILASDYCASKESLHTYVKDKSLGENVLKSSMYKRLLKDFAVYLVRKGCCMESEDESGSYETFRYFLMRQGITLIKSGVKY